MIQTDSTIVSETSILREIRRSVDSLDYLNVDILGNEIMVEISDEEISGEDFVRVKEFMKERYSGEFKRLEPGYYTITFVFERKVEQ
ncbi:hypothetical protein ACNF40_06550 [Cuniculiplasma sp. SKW4]|uniref:hypothetical protein n=1 Tax=Cuniculiplasma sp. SKW4 TaxID=3400171 RepID=UPI003FD6A7DF